MRPKAKHRQDELSETQSDSLGGANQAVIDEENRLARLIPCGDEQAFSRLYETHIKSLQKYFYAKTKDMLAVEELTSETFLQVLEGLSRGVEFRRGFRHWLYGIANHLYLSWSQKKKRQPVSCELSSVEKLEDKGMIVLEEILERERISIVWKLAARLHPSHQKILFLHYNADLSYSEIAQEMGRTVQACRTLNDRALRKLRALIQAEALDEVLVETFLLSKQAEDPSP